jgi:hypothetical protein
MSSICSELKIRLSLELNSPLPLSNVACLVLSLRRVTANSQKAPARSAREARCAPRPSACGAYFACLRRARGPLQSTQTGLIPPQPVRSLRSLTPRATPRGPSAARARATVVQCWAHRDREGVLAAPAARPGGGQASCGAVLGGVERGEAVEVRGEVPTSEASGGSARAEGSRGVSTGPSDRRERGKRTASHSPRPPRGFLTLHDSNPCVSDRGDDTCYPIPHPFRPPNSS